VRFSFDPQAETPPVGHAEMTPTSPLAPFAAKLHRLVGLNDAALADIDAWPHRTTRVSAGRYLVREGTRVVECCILVDGYAYCQKTAGDGGRQIVSFHLPGDILDLQHLLLDYADHSVQTMTDAVIAWVPVKVMREAALTHRAICEAFWRDSLVDASIFRESVLNVGRRDARARVAHLLCEFVTRRAATRVDGRISFALPMTQEQIADATGLTPVHVNRTLQSLGADGLITRDRRQIVIDNWDRLRAAADFNPAYLHLGQPA